jgi:Ca2+-binding RTX toxin-like protein
MAQGGNGGGATKGVNKVLGNWKDNVLIGTDGVDAISGRDGNDTLFGLAGLDELDGGEGDDVLNGGQDADIIDGGNGVDWASWDGSATGVIVDLAAGTGSGGDADGDTLISIEYLDGSQHDDVLRGDAGVNHIRGNGGNDNISGGAVPTLWTVAWGSIGPRGTDPPPG